MQVAAGGPVGTELSEPATESSEVIGLVAAMIILAFTFGTLVAMGLPIISAVFGLVVGLSLIGLLGHVTNIPTVAPTLATMIGLGVGIDYALFLVSRYRALLKEGLEVHDAIATAVATSGSAIVFAGTTVVIALVTLLIAGIPLVTSLGYASAFAVVTAVLAALTLLPAIFSLLGRHVESVRVPAFMRPKPKPPERGFWGAWARAVTAHPWLAIGAVLAILVPLAIPFLSLNLGQEDVGATPSSTTERQAYDLISRRVRRRLQRAAGSSRSASARPRRRAASSSANRSRRSRCRSSWSRSRSRARPRSSSSRASRPRYSNSRPPWSSSKRSSRTSRRASSGRRAALQAEQSSLKAQQSKLQAQQVLIIEQLNELGAQAAQLVKKGAKLAKEGAAVTKKLARNRAKQKKVTIELQHAKSPARQKKLEAQLLALQKEEDALQKQLNQVLQQEQALRKQSQRIVSKSAQLRAQESKLVNQTIALAGQATGTAKEAVSLVKEKEQLITEASNLQVQAANLQTQAANLNTQEVQLQGQQQTAKTQQQQAEQLQTELTQELTKAGGDERGTDPRLVNLQDALSATEGVKVASPPSINKKGDATTFTVIATTAPAATQTADLVKYAARHTRSRRRRGNRPPRVRRRPDRELRRSGQRDLLEAPARDRRRDRARLPGADDGLPVGGHPDAGGDLERAVGRRPRSASSPRASSGVGAWGSSDSTSPGDTVPIASYVPLIMFAVVFGLSMDYQVFLMSQIEHHKAQGRATTMPLRAGSPQAPA